jgi:ATPase components of ABC transporters with duplicated ATPase domains
MGTIQIKNVSFKYHQMTTDIFKDLNLKIDSSWKLGLIGRNGRGKTTLMKLLLGQLTYQGQIISDLNFNYYPQTVSDRSQTTLEVIQSLTDLEDYDFWKIEIEMEQLQLSEEVLRQAFETLSPGEQTKVLLATLFVDEAGFQLLDEPTNHLDIAGRKVVADYLQNKKGFIVISHDKTFLNQIIDHVISINRNDVTVYKGNFDTWETANENQLQLEMSQSSSLKMTFKDCTRQLLKEQTGPNSRRVKILTVPAGR